MRRDSAVCADDVTGSGGTGERRVHPALDSALMPTAAACVAKALALP